MGTFCKLTKKETKKERREHRSSASRTKGKDAAVAEITDKTETRKQACILERYSTRTGHIKTIKWLHENRTEGCTTDAMDEAAWRGHLKVMEWLHRNRSEGCTKMAMLNAAERGHLGIVKWLHANRSEGRRSRSSIPWPYGRSI